ncbi:hypothetical protein AMTRI_Chr01g102410 [Amborella trichopoda]|uniref:V-type proton ATPase subunit S1/VOA1 transmembrane domain-containing protein n=1 Tax=Amborella trichopoda TaxID=13333 RepID=W1NNB6_AMBTC|nr:uncharacterized protein LOC18425160 [Amborella trichopoda]XP_020517605.1 uncharacterized protein LOC18425160 [Amborella trichopoda]ERM97207.1 hypothetical protein AMTR_s00119p00054590 [Amborella trichopoda]|eukprot:XP_006829791.1 uncharacterized protein LOC18425160 [Amborella trichopoda]
MEGSMVVYTTLLFVALSVLLASSFETTAPAFLWSNHLHRSSSLGGKEIVDYHTISMKGLAKSVMSEGGWSNLMCSGRNQDESVDIALVFIGRKLRSSDISRTKHTDSALVELLKVSFTESNFSMAFPYVDVSEENETLENSLISGFLENCEHGLEVSEVALLGSCSIWGKDLKKFVEVNSVKNYVSSRMETRQKGKTDLIVICDEDSISSEEFGLDNTEGKLLAEVIDKVKESGATHTVLYASDPRKSLLQSGHRDLGRFLAESAIGNASNSTCDSVCQIKSSLLEGVFVAIVLLIILISGLCCMMGIQTPTRFETPQES